MIKPELRAGRLDWRDLKILALVQVNGRVSKKVLADTLGISLGPCFQRVRRLEQLGFIRGYRGVVDAARLGPFLRVYTEVELSRHRPANVAGFEAAIRELPEVVGCDAVAGGIDYVLQFVVRDVVHYQQLIDALLDRDIGIGRYTTHFVLAPVKDCPAVPIAALLGENVTDPRLNRLSQ